MFNNRRWFLIRAVWGFPASRKLPRVSLIVLTVFFFFSIFDWKPSEQIFESLSRQKQTWDQSWQTFAVYIAQISYTSAIACALTNYQPPSPKYDHNNLILIWFILQKVGAGRAGAGGGGLNNQIVLVGVGRVGQCLRIVPDGGELADWQWGENWGPPPSTLLIFLPIRSIVVPQCPPDFLPLSLTPHLISTSSPPPALLPHIATYIPQIYIFFCLSKQVLQCVGST